MQLHEHNTFVWLHLHFAAVVHLCTRHFGPQMLWHKILITRSSNPVLKCLTLGPKCLIGALALRFVFNAEVYEKHFGPKLNFDLKSSI